MLDHFHDSILFTEKFFIGLYLSMVIQSFHCRILITVRTPREVRWEWGGHERLRYTLSQNMRPPQHNALLYWGIQEYNEFGIGIGGVRMRSKITPFYSFCFPADFSWRADSN
jgi:hypothetical protein